MAQVLLDQLGEEDLLAEIPVEELGVDRPDDVAQLERLVAAKPGDEVDDAQRREGITAAGQLRRRQVRVRHTVRR